MNNITLNYDDASFVLDAISIMESDGDRLEMELPDTDQNVKNLQSILEIQASIMFNKNPPVYFDALYDGKTVNCFLISITYDSIISVVVKIVK